MTPTEVCEVGLSQHTRIVGDVSDFTASGGGLGLVAELNDADDSAVSELLALRPTMQRGQESIVDAPYSAL